MGWQSGNILTKPQSPFLLPSVRGVVIRGWEKIQLHPILSPRSPHLFPGHTVASWDLQSHEKDKEDPVFRGAHMVTVLPDSLRQPRRRQGAAQMVPGWCQGLPVARTPRDNKGNEAFWLEIRCHFSAAEDSIPKGEMDLPRLGLGTWWRPEKRCSGASSLIHVWEVSWGPHTHSSVSFAPSGTMSNLSLVGDAAVAEQDIQAASLGLGAVSGVGKPWVPLKGG